MKKIMMSLVVISLALCGTTIAAEEKGEYCFYIRSETGELIEICEDHPCAVQKGINKPCNGPCWD